MNTVHSMVTDHVMNVPGILSWTTELSGTAKKYSDLKSERTTCW